MGGTARVRQIHRLLAEGQPWSIEKLQAANLPLYGCESWVRAHVQAGTSWTEIARLAGQDVPMRSVHQWCLAHFEGLQSTKPNVTHKGKTKGAEALVAAGMTRAEAAEQLGVSTTAVALKTRNLPKNPGAAADSKLYLQQRLSALEWPADLTQIAEAFFGGDRNQASKWAAENVQAGHLVRVSRGVYERKVTP